MKVNVKVSVDNDGGVVTMWRSDDGGVVKTVPVCDITEKRNELALLSFHSLVLTWT